MNTSTDQHPLRRQISAALERYFVLKDRSPDLVVHSPECFAFDGRAEWIPEILARTSIHEEDYCVFRHLTDPGEVFLDIGANYGYSAASVWATGATCAVLSFEPIFAFEPCLAAISRMRPGRHDYRMIGLGAETGTARFVTPVVNATGVSALTTTAESPCLQSLDSNLESYIDLYMGAPRDVSLRFFEFTAPIDRLDNVMKHNHFSVPMDRVSAIKIHTEGFESAVVEGARETLSRYRPLVMIGGGNRMPGVQQMMVDLGYFYADRDRDVLRASLGTTVGYNGYFLHPARAAAYRAMGLLAD